MPNVKIRVESVSDEELQTQQPMTDKKVSGEKVAVASIFAHQAINLTKQVINAGISNIGNFTGDYVKQDQVQQAVNILGDITTFATATATGGWVGAIVAAVGLGTKYTINAITENKKQQHADRQTDYMQKISGNSTTNGSRV